MTPEQEQEIERIKQNGRNERMAIIALTIVVCVFIIAFAVGTVLSTPGFRP